MHGGEFIQYALRQGAGAILTDRAGADLAQAELAGADAALVVVEDPRAAFAHACALWFGAQPETMVAVTGTNGKTSVASFTRQIWAALGREAANIGTTGVEGAFSAPGIHTTPELVERRLEQGFRMVTVTSDLLALRSGAVQALTTYKQFQPDLDCWYWSMILLVKSSWYQGGASSRA